MWARHKTTVLWFHFLIHFHGSQDSRKGRLETKLSNTVTCECQLILVDAQHTYSLVSRPLPDFISQPWRKIGRRPGIIATSRLSGHSLTFQQDCQPSLLELTSLTHSTSLCLTFPTWSNIGKPWKYSCVVVSSPGHSQILSRSHGEKLGEGLGSLLHHDWVDTRWLFSKIVNRHCWS